MIRRFQGEDGRRFRLEALAGQKIFGGNRALAEAADHLVDLREIAEGEVLIEQHGTDNDLYLILAGAFDVLVNKKHVARRFAGNHVGEMAAIDPSMKRTATVIATEQSVVGKISATDLARLADDHPEIYRHIAKEVASRLKQRNMFAASHRDRSRVFIISSSEALEVATAVATLLQHDAFDVEVWNKGVFMVSSYPLESLEEAVERADFAIAIASGDDITETRGKSNLVPRDNVVFELGLFMGRLGRSRAILMESLGQGVKLPSDLTGLTTIRYQHEPGVEVATQVGAACSELRDHILRLGPNN